MRTNYYVIGIVFCFLSVATQSPALTVSGKITDVAGHELPGIRVEVWHDGWPTDTRIATVSTNASGDYSSAVASGTDVYIVVMWQWELINFPPHVVKVEDNNGVVYTNKTSSTQDNISTDVVINMQMDQEAVLDGSSPARGAFSELRHRIETTLVYVEDYKGTTNWSVNYDVPVHVLNPTAGPSELNNQLYLPPDTFNGQGSEYRNTSIYHETAHLIMERIGASLDGLSPHYFNTEGNPRVAMTEGWAGFLPIAIGHTIAGANVSIARDICKDDGTSNTNFPAHTLWRGDEANQYDATRTYITFATTNSSLTTAWNGTHGENGEVVEGAVAGTLWEMSTNPAIGFTRIFQAVVSAEPATFWDLCRELASQEGSGSQAVRQMHHIMQKHGIVYNRLQWNSTQPFTDSDPPNAAPPSPGNYKVLGGFVFVRGVLTAQYTSVSADMLGVSHTLSNKKLALGWKHATTGLDSSAEIAGWAIGTDIDYASFYAPNEYSWDTKIKVGSDGDYDVIFLSRENDDGIEDTLLPTWGPSPLGSPTGPRDGTATVSSDERYLKMIRAWFDSDGDPATEDDGQIVIDNTAPKVVSGSLTPAP